MTKFYFDLLFYTLIICGNSWLLYRNIKTLRKSDSQLESHIRKVDRKLLNKYSIEELKVDAKRRAKKIILSSIFLYFIMITLILELFH